MPYQGHCSKIKATTFGTPNDMSKVCNFRWYQWVYYQETGSFPETKEKVGHVLGQILNEGNEMAQAVLNAKGEVVPRRSKGKLLKKEIHSESEKRKQSIFYDLILKKLGDSMHMSEQPGAPDHV